MRKLIIPPSHYFMTINKDAAEICQPLFNTSPIKAFCYVRFYKDNTSFGILTSKKWLIHHFSLRYDLGPPKHLVNFNKAKSSCIISENETNSLDMLKSYHYALNLAYPFYTLENNKDYIDMYMYCLDASLNSSSGVNFYLNNVEVLEKFNLYFKHKASNLIDNCDRNRMVLSKEAIPSFMKNDQHINYNLVEYNVRFDNDRNENRYNKLQLLSNRESECVKFILQGYSAKEIAKELAISYRTVETFIFRIKGKYNVRKISELVAKIASDVNL